MTSGMSGAGMLSGNAGGVPGVQRAPLYRTLYQRVGVAQTLLSVLVMLATSLKSSASASSVYKLQPLLLARAQTRVSVPHQSRGKLGEYNTAFKNSGSVPRQKRRKCGSSAKVITWPRPYGSLTR